MASTDELLDGMIIEFFETLNSISEVRDQLNNSLKSGYLMMSKARYSMGAKSISSLQYSENNMTALVNVVDSNDESAPFLYKRLDTSITETNKSGDRLLINNKAQDGIRKRVVHKSSIDGDAFNNEGTKDSELLESISNEVETLGIDDTNRTEEILPEAADSVEKIVDPLNWFGLLVPENLRRCQTEFKQSVMLCVKLANLQTKLISLQENYRKLKRSHDAK